MGGWEAGERSIPFFCCVPMRVMLPLAQVLHAEESQDRMKARLGNLGK